jgi:hypothetical protein
MLRAGQKVVWPARSSGCLGSYQTMMFEAFRAVFQAV